jgi:hypothetical protein
VRQCGGLGVLDNPEAISAIEGLSWRFADGEKVYGSVSGSRLDPVTHSGNGSLAGHALNTVALLSKRFGGVRDGATNGEAELETNAKPPFHDEAPKLRPGAEDGWITRDCDECVARFYCGDDSFKKQGLFRPVLAARSVVDG